MLFCGATPTPVFVIDAAPPVAIPEVVKGRGDEIRSLAYDKIVALLIQGIKEQQSQIDELRSDVDLLKSKL